jgi:hypothetical protein
MKTLRGILLTTLMLTALSVSVAQTKKVTQLATETAPTSDDLTMTVNDPAGTPESRKVTLANLFFAMSPWHFCADAGANDTYACNLGPAPGSYVTGVNYVFKANTANTGAATMNFNSLGAKTIKKSVGGVTTDLDDNDIRADQIITLIYDGTNMQMQSMLGNSSASGAPTTATYITQTADGTLSNEQALGALATGVLKSTTTTGVVSIATTDDISSPVFCSDAGANDTYACSLSPVISSYVTGTHYRFKANTANTGAATINLNSIGAKTIKKVAGGITTDLSDNDILSGQWVDLAYDGTNMQMQSTLGNAASGGSSPTADFAMSGDITPSQITSNQNDYNPTGLSTASVLRLSTDASRDITGLQGGADGRFIIIDNVGSNLIVLKDEGSGSSAANRFALVVDQYVNPDQLIVLKYDATTSRWRINSNSLIQQTATDTLKILSSTAKLYFNTNTRFEWDGTVLKLTDGSNNVTLETRTLQLDANSNQSYYVNANTGILVGANIKLGFARNSTLVTPGTWLENKSAQRGLFSVWGNFGSGDVGGTFAFKPERPAQITTNQNDYQTASVSKYVFLDSSGAVNITGLKDTTSPSANFAQDGEERVIVNNGSNNITLKNEDAASTAQFRFHNSTGADIVLAADQAADLVYDSTLSRWRVFKRN